MTFSGKHRGAKGARMTLGLALGLTTLGLAALAPTAFAAPSESPLDAKISIERAASSPTLTVRYSGAAATLVELRVNGKSIATRDVSSKDDAGETTFTLALADLNDGENAVEIRLLDASGAIVGTHKSTVLAAPRADGPVKLVSPKNGATIEGPLEMTVSFARALKNPFVSFFVDDDFKSMTNFPPYTFLWDSTKATNGWHEIEAWAVDEGTETYKSRKIRVFINNPGGRTERVPLGGETPAKSAPAKEPPTKTAPAKETPVKAAPVVKPAAPVLAPAVAKPVKPPVQLDLIANAGTGRDLARPRGLKPIATGAPIPLGPQAMTPTGARVFRPKTTAKTPVAKPALAQPTVVAKAPAAAIAKLPATKPAVTPLARVSIARGTRLTGVSSFAVLLNGRYVEFDVAPRVDEGVPMTPFRHLIEKAGGSVDWTNATKTVSANADGKAMTIKIGDASALLGSARVRLEAVPYLERGRTIVPVSFLKDALGVEIEYDRATNHVLITQAKK